MDYQYTKNLLDKVWPGWEPVRKIGKGSFGTVYEIQKVNGNMVDYAALKIISIPEDGAAIPMGKDKQTLTTYYENIADGMVQEYDIMSRLKQSGCENVVACDSYVKVPNRNGLGLKLLIQMELLTDLNTYTRRYGFSRQNVIRLGIDICKALESCKAAHVIHRDIKPANLFVSADGVYKLGDFGVAKRLEETGYAGSKQGTILYMAPEVYANQAYDTRADIYSLGLVMYQLMNKGELPFASGIFSDQEQGEALRKRMRGDKIPMPAEDGELGKIVCCACEYNYWDRYSTPGEMRRALEKLLNPDDDKMLLFPVDIDNEVESEIRIRFMSDEGKVLKEEIYQSGQQVVPPKMVGEIEREGVQYRFSGWEPSVPERAIESMDYKAVYEEIVFEQKENKKRLIGVVIAGLFLILFGALVWILPKILKTSFKMSEQSDVVAEIEDVNSVVQNEGKWSEWVVQLPKQVTEEDYEIKQKTQYSSRKREIVESEKANLEGWELYDSYSVPIEGNWSEWSENKILESENCEVREKKMYKYCDLQETTSLTSELTGWTYVGSTEEWSDYGEWSEWLFNEVESDESRKIKTRTVSSYYYFYCFNCGRNVRYPVCGPGHNCSKCGAPFRIDSGTVGWFETPWANSTYWGEDRYSQTINGEIWWVYDVDDGRDNFTQYSYKEREMITTYHFTKWGEWSSWTDTEVQPTSNRKVETVQMYSFREIGKKTMYMYEKLGEWSDFSDTIIISSENLDVKKQVLYSYRKK